MRASISASKSRRRRRVCLEVLEDRQLLSTIMVNTTADDTTPDSTLSLREAIEVSNGTLPVSSLSTQEQAQVSGAVSSTNTIDFNVPKTDPGYNATTGVWTIAPKSALPTITHQRGDHQWLQPAGLEQEHTGPGRQREAGDRDRRGNRGLDQRPDDRSARIADLRAGHREFLRGRRADHGHGVQVAGCFIGTDPTGETAASNGAGVILENSSNMIGGPDVG